MQSNCNTADVPRKIRTAVPELLGANSLSKISHIHHPCSQQQHSEEAAAHLVKVAQEPGGVGREGSRAAKRVPDGKRATN